MRILKLHALVLIILAATQVYANSEGPSFNCEGKLSKAESAICKNNILSKLDRSLAAIYSAKLEIVKREQYASSRIEKIKKAQRKWVKSKEICSDDISCLKSMFSIRIDELTKQISYWTNSMQCPDSILNSYSSCKLSKLTKLDNDTIYKEIVQVSRDSGEIDCTLQSIYNIDEAGKVIESSLWESNCESYYPLYERLEDKNGWKLVRKSSGMDAVFFSSYQRYNGGDPWQVNPVLVFHDGKWTLVDVLKEAGKILEENGVGYLKLINYSGSNNLEIWTDMKAECCPVIEDLSFSIKGGEVSVADIGKLNELKAKYNKPEEKAEILK